MTPSCIMAKTLHPSDYRLVHNRHPLVTTAQYHHLQRWEAGSRRYKYSLFFTKYCTEGARRAYTIGTAMRAVGEVDTGEVETAAEVRAMADRSMSTRGVKKTSDSSIEQG